MPRRVAAATGPVFTTAAISLPTSRRAETSRQSRRSASVAWLGRTVLTYAWNLALIGVVGHCRSELVTQRHQLGDHIRRLPCRWGIEFRCGTPR